MVANSLAARRFGFHEPCLEARAGRPAAVVADLPGSAAERLPIGCRDRADETGVVAAVLTPLPWPPPKTVHAITDLIQLAAEEQ